MSRSRTAHRWRDGCLAIYRPAVQLCPYITARKSVTRHRPTPFWGPMTNVFSTPDRRLFREKIFFFLALNDFHLAPTKRRKRSKHVLARSNCPRVFKCWRPSLRLIAIVTCWGGEGSWQKREDGWSVYCATEAALRVFSSTLSVISLPPTGCVCVFIIRYKAQVFIFPKTTRSSTNQPREWQGEKLFCATRQVGHSPALFISFDVLEHIRDFPLSFVGTPFISGCCCRWWLLYSVPWKRRRRRRWRPGPSLFGPDGAWISVCAPGRPGARDGTLRERERGIKIEEKRGGNLPKLDMTLYGQLVVALHHRRTHNGFEFH